MDNIPEVSEDGPDRVSNDILDVLCSLGIIEVQSQLVLNLEQIYPWVDPSGLAAFSNSWMDTS